MKLCKILCLCLQKSETKNVGHSLITVKIEKIDSHPLKNFNKQNFLGTTKSTSNFFSNINSAKKVVLLVSKYCWKQAL